MSTSIQLESSRLWRRSRGALFAVPPALFLFSLGVLVLDPPTWVLAAGLISTIVLVIIRSVLVARRQPVAASIAARGRLEDAQALYSRNSIGAYALGADKQAFAVAGGAVAYTVRAGVALAAGDPLAPGAISAEVAAAFVAHCRRQGWIPAFYQAIQRDFGLADLQALKIGEEAMIDLPSFSLKGKAIANVRHCVTHCERAGLTAEVYPRGVESESVLEGLDAVSAAWLAARPGRGEMGFSMGSYSRGSMRTACVAVARDACGQICAFVTFRPFGEPEAPSLVLDLMRRLDDAPSGTVDFVIAAALNRFRQDGYQQASLSLAPLAGLGNEVQRPRTERMLGLLYEKGNGLYHYKSLFSFKRKFAPHWQPRYLLYPGGVLTLARVLLAVALLHLPQRPRPTLKSMAHQVGDLVRQMLDWRAGLRPGHLGLNLRLMTVITLAFAAPELAGALQLLGRPHIALAYALLALMLALGDVSGALALSRRWDAGRLLLVLTALGFFVKTAWGLAAHYDGGLISWAVALVLVPVEVWVIWFLLQPEVREHFGRGPAALPSRQAGTLGV